MKKSQTTYTNIGESRGKPRIWIEGVKLSVAGFSKGVSYSLCDLANQVLELELDENGRRTVSGRKRNTQDMPIIDLSAEWVAKKFEGVNRLKVTFSEGRIRIEPNVEELNQGERESRILKNLKRDTITKGTLCVGGAISTTALADSAKTSKLHTNMVWVVDLDLRYLQSAAKNSWAITDETHYIVGKLEEVEASEYSRVDILSVSLECSGFSGAGKSKHKQSSTEHKGAGSIFGLITAIKASNPAVVVSENVVEALDSPSYQLITGELERLGYQVFHKILEPEHTSTFERRRRYWFVAISVGLSEGFEFLIPDVDPDEVLLADLLDQTVKAEMWCENDYLKKKAILDKKAGKGFARQLLTGAESFCGTIGKHYAKKRSTEPFITRSDGKERLLTPAEHCRVKSIPEELVDGVPTTTAHQILGQSVDYLQAFLVGDSIFKHLRRVSHG